MQNKSKNSTPEKQADFVRQHEIALLSLLIPKYLKKSVEIIKKTCKDKNNVVNLSTSG